MKTTSGMVMSVCGPLKDILVIISSAIIFASPVTALQWFGFSISLCGIFAYQQYKRDTVGFVQQAESGCLCIFQTCNDSSSNNSNNNSTNSSNNNSNNNSNYNGADVEEQQGLLMIDKQLRQ